MDQAGPAGDDTVAPGEAEGSAGPAHSLAVTDGEQAGAGGKDVHTGTAARDRPAARWARSAPVRQIAILLGFLAAAIVLTWPRASYLYDHQLPATRDAAGFVWDFYWIAHQVVHLSNPWSTRYIAAPVGTQLGFHTLMPLPGLVMTPVTLAFGPSASYNLLSALTPGLLGYAMYRVGRLWLRSQVAAVAAGAFFGLSSMLTNQSWYELNLALGALFIPLALEGAVRLRRRPGWPQAVFLGVVLGAALLTDQESAILAMLAAILALLPWVIAGRVRELAGRLWPVLLAAAVTAVVASPQIIAMGQQAAAGGASFPPHQLAVAYTLYGAGLLGLFSPSPRIATFGLQTPASFFYQHGIINPAHAPATSNLVVSYVPMFGVSLTVLAIFGLLVSARRRNAWLLALLAVGCAILALGPALWVGAKEYIPLAQSWDGVRLSMLMPYTWLVHTPGLSNFREAYRFLALGLAGMALLAASAVEWLRYHAAKPVLAVVLAACLLELGWGGNPPGHVMPASLQISTMATSYPKVDGPIAADRSSSIVVDFPFGIRGGPPVYGQPFAPQSELMATADGHPLADALISRVPSATVSGIQSHPFYACMLAAYSAPRKLLTPAQYNAIALDARQMDVGWVVVWPSRVPHAISRYLGYTGFRLAYQVRGVKVYRRAAVAPAGPAPASTVVRLCTKPSLIPRTVG